jgi:hypothetical protein
MAYFADEHITGAQLSSELKAWNNIFRAFLICMAVRDIGDGISCEN